MCATWICILEVKQVKELRQSERPIDQVVKYSVDFHTSIWLFSKMHLYEADFRAGVGVIGFTTHFCTFGDYVRRSLFPCLLYMLYIMVSDDPWSWSRMKSCDMFISVTLFALNNNFAVFSNMIGLHCWLVLDVLHSFRFLAWKPLHHLKERGVLRNRTLSVHIQLTASNLYRFNGIMCTYLQGCLALLLSSQMLKAKLE